MTTIGLQARLDSAHRLLQSMRRRALREPYWYDGRSQPPSRDLFRATHQILDQSAPLTLGLVLDHGHHASGWFRNSDYDRCLHLSLSCPDLEWRGSVAISADRPGRPVGGGFLPIPTQEIRLWAGLCFGQDQRWLWREGGQYIREVVHLRLFLDQQNQPVMPVGEVYDLKPWADGTSPEKIFRI